MALHIITWEVLKLLQSNFLSDFLNFFVHILNFAVLLSYPINFFIYCRMSRAFRDAFTQLLCPSVYRSRQERIPSATTQLIPKLNHNNSHNHLEVNHTNIEMKNTSMEILPPSSVILNATIAETPMFLTPTTTPCHIVNDGKKNSISSLGKQRVLFRDDINTSTNTKFTDL